MQTAHYIARLGDLDNEIVKVARVADLLAKDAKGDGVGRLKDSVKSVQDKQKYVQEAKNCLLGFEGFMQAQAAAMQSALQDGVGPDQVRPVLAKFFTEVANRTGGAVAHHVEAIVNEVTASLERVSHAAKDLQEEHEDELRTGSVKESAGALSKVCASAEKALTKAVKKGDKSASTPEHGYEHMFASEEEEEEMADKEAHNHGYNLTAGLPPEFLENAKKKKEEAKGKKDDDKEEDEGKKASEILRDLFGERQEEEGRGQR
jgi:hypothetical protein